MELCVWSLILILTLSIRLQSGGVFAQDDSTCLAMLGGIDMTKHCSQTKSINGSLVISVSSHQYKVIPKCQNCSVTIVTADDNNLVATLYKLGTEISNSSAAECDINRLDIFDGNSSEISKILSDEVGICGCKLPDNTVFKSSGNAITVRLQTTCDQTTHGELELVVTSVKSELFNHTDCAGQFKCKTSGECVDKYLVCDGKAGCRDESDENDCKMKNITCLDMFTCKSGQCINKNGVCDGNDQCHDGSDEIGCHRIKANLAIILLGVAAIICLIMLFITIAVGCKFYTARKSEYKQFT
ncbi:sortilin-related receptor-like [Dreissena polymorpha]|uniref:CUB domain-containing protein n=1 Tax=Dreissena polymorpha TaxID=45954 RepID=A0A9D4G5I5_DREPO|nr:sortilin-related receptor-like [Dreissena polymorpha]KAH3808950.1 hypothetical protein DPMN_137312 [Dreissena polymorpha]